MLTANSQRPTARTLLFAAVTLAAVMGAATWLGYLLGAGNASSQPQPALWVGLAFLLVALAIAGWSIRAVTAAEDAHKKQNIQFVSTAIHDLRQPLQAATLFVDSLLHASLSSQPLKAVQCLDQSIQSVRHILDGLLDVSRLDAGAVLVKKQAFSPIALLRALESEFEPHASSQNLRVRLYYPPRDVCVNGDPQLVLMMVRNLLIHALAQPQQGSVLLAVRQRPSQVCIQVWSDHINTSKESSKPMERNLAIARRAAELMQSPLIFEVKTGRWAVHTVVLSRDNTLPTRTSSGV